MRRLITLCGCIALLLCLGVPAQAATTTITFDEIEAWNSNPPYLGDEYLHLGVQFVSMDWYMVGGIDGGIYDPTWGIVGSNGEQFAAFDGSTEAFWESAGFRLSFDVPMHITLDYTTGEGTTTYSDMYWMVETEEGVWLTGILPVAPVGEWLTLDVSTLIDDQYGNPLGAVDNFQLALPMVQGESFFGMDNLQFAPVPIPASLLLLGTGLVPLLRLRRKK